MRVTQWLCHFFLRKLVKVYPFLKSKTGYLNPRVRNITEFGFKIRSYLDLTPNPNRWKINQAELFPAVIQVQTINRCNAACKMCPYPYTTAKEEYREMPEELWQKIAEECAGEPQLQILIPMSKNEPLLDKRLSEKIHYFKTMAQSHQMVELVSNGDLLNDESMKRLIDSGLDMITISLNATNPVTFQKTMQKLSWEKIINNLREIKSLDLSKINVFIRLIRQKDNYKEVDQFRRYWKKEGFNVLIYNVNNRSGTVKKYERLLEPQTFKLRIRNFFKRKLSQNIFPVCPYAFSMANILANGDMPLCLNDWGNREILGNVKHQSIREIYNSSKVNNLRSLMCQNRYDEIDPCRNCSLWKNSDWL